MSEAARRLYLKGGMAADRVLDLMHRHGARLPAELPVDMVVRTFEGPITHPDVLVLESQCWPSGRFTHHLEWNWERARAPR
jgi:hypothetical protein